MSWPNRSLHHGSLSKPSQISRVSQVVFRRRQDLMFETHNSRLNVNILSQLQRHCHCHSHYPPSYTLVSLLQPCIRTTIVCASHVHCTSVTRTLYICHAYIVCLSRVHCTSVTRTLYVHHAYIVRTRWYCVADGHQIGSFQDSVGNHFTLEKYRNFSKQ